MADEYPDLKTVKDLAKYPELFPDPEDASKGIIYGGITGWSITEVMEKKVSAYGLDQYYNYFVSGSDAVLARMKRGYNTRQFLEAVARIRGMWPQAAFTTDVIVGFPGETEEEFQQTLTFLHRCAFAAMHIFPSSKRPDTPAAKMPGQVLNAVKEERARRAAETAAEMEHTYLSQWVGQTVPVLFEEEQGGLWRGHTAHYCAVAAPRDLHNCLVQVQLEGLEGNTLKGVVL